VQKGKEPDRRSRLQRLEDSGGSARLPEVSAAGHLVTRLFQIGPAISTGMGEGPLSFVEIECWQRVSRVRLTGWEGATLRRMSAAYASERSIAGNDPKRAAPWPEGIVGAQRAVADSLRLAMRAAAED